MDRWDCSVQTTGQKTEGEQMMTESTVADAALWRRRRVLKVGLGLLTGDTIIIRAIRARAAAAAPVALIIAQGGLGDQSYNDLAYSGFQAALKATGLKGKPVESKEVVAQGNDILRRAADAGFGLIVDLR